MEKLEVGGNKVLLWWGNILTKWANKCVNKGKKLVVTNPTCKFHSPWVLIINFTVNVNDKYTLTLQGDYKEKYKEKGDEENPITVDEMFMLIRDGRDKWYLKS